MAKELVREKIMLDQSAGRETTQVLIEGDMIVPDVKPDIAVMLQADARAVIDRTEASADRVNFMGKLEISALYLAKGAEKPVCSMHLVSPIDDFINMDGVTKEMWVESKCEIANIDYKMVNDRKINYRAIVTVCVNAESPTAQEIVVNIGDVPENQLLRRALSVNRSVESKMERFSVKDEISVPSGKPNIREILQTTATVTNKEVRLAHGRVTVTGEIAVATLYRGDDDDSVIEFMESEIPFNGMIEAANAREDMYADVALTIQDQYIQVRPDSDGEDRVVEVELSMGARVKVHSAEKLEALEDAYCINQTLDISRTPIKYPRLVCRNRNQTAVKEVFQIDSGCPDILQIFRVKGTAHLDETKVIDDKIIAEGVIYADVLYVAESDDTPLYSYKATVPYRQVIETKDARPGMNVDVEATVEHASFNMLSGREMELRFMLAFNAAVTEELEMNVVTDVAFADMDRCLLDSMPSMIIYVVQKGDSLWNIAKRYNTGVDELLALNEVENPEKIYPGQKLLILKRAA